MPLSSFVAHFLLCYTLTNKPDTQTKNDTTTTATATTCKPTNENKNTLKHSISFAQPSPSPPNQRTNTTYYSQPPLQPFSQQSISILVMLAHFMAY
jgi:hypothetical protein